MKTAILLKEKKIKSNLYYNQKSCAKVKAVLLMNIIHIRNKSSIYILCIRNFPNITNTFFSIIFESTSIFGYTDFWLYSFAINPLDEQL